MVAAQRCERLSVGSVIAVIRYRRCVMPQDAETRIAAAIPPLDAHARRRALAEDWDLSLLDPTDSDERSILIRLVVATQIIDGEPPEMFETADRLIAAGRDPHDVLHMLGSTVSDQIWSVTHHQRPYDRAAHIAALTALPGGWDQIAQPARERVQPRGGRRPRRR
jgi:hypothetical protein